MNISQHTERTYVCRVFCKRIRKRPLIPWSRMYPTHSKPIWHPQNVLETPRNGISADGKLHTNFNGTQPIPIQKPLTSAEYYNNRGRGRDRSRGRGGSFLSHLKSKSPMIYRKISRQYIQRDSQGTAGPEYQWEDEGWVTIHSGYCRAFFINQITALTHPPR